MTYETYSYSDVSYTIGIHPIKGYSFKTDGGPCFWCTGIWFKTKEEAIKSAKDFIDDPIPMLTKQKKIIQKRKKNLRK